jgi:hypothetical protein
LNIEGVSMDNANRLAGAVDPVTGGDREAKLVYLFSTYIVSTNSTAELETM